MARRFLRNGQVHSMSAIPETQKALAIPAQGLPYTLSTRDVPRPGSGQVLIKLEGLGLNPGEWKGLKLDLPKFFQPLGLALTYPVYMGQDGAGTVVAAGDGVKGVAVGDRVTFQGWFERDLSAYQQYALAEADFVAQIPSSMSFLEAASLPLALATAALGLSLPFTINGGLGLKGFWEDDAEGHYKGQAILIFGGSSSIGQYAIQIARYLGFSTIITTSSIKHKEFLQQLGATHVVDRNADVVAQIKNVVGDSGFSYIYDAVHHPLSQTEVDFLAPGGKLLSANGPPPALTLTDDRQVTFVLGFVHLHRDAGKKMYAKLPQFLQKGIIKPNRVEKVSGGLNGVAEGLKRLEADQVSGHKLVVVPSETTGA